MQAVHMTQHASPAPTFPMSTVPCPRTIDEIGATGRPDRLGQVCGELMMAPAPAGEPGDDSYYCEHCGQATLRTVIGDAMWEASAERVRQSYVIAAADAEDAYYARPTAERLLAAQRAVAEMNRVMGTAVVATVAG